jgi:superfamily II DNA helicase RecQ
MVFAKEDLYFSLQKYFGFDRFKGNQEDIILSVLAGRDTLSSYRREVVNRCVISSPP